MTTDQPFAARLRARAAEARAGWSRETPPSAKKDRIRGRTFRQLNESDEGAVVLSAEDVEAIADALELLAEFMDATLQFDEQSWYDEEGVEGTEIRVFGHDWEQRFQAALEALNRRGAKA